MKPFLLAFSFLVIAGCGAPPVGDAPEAAAARPMSSLPPSAARDTLQGIRSHAGLKRF